MQRKTNNIFEKITIAPVDPILGINQLYNKNTDLKKINLSIGTYRTDDGKSYILPIVRKIEKNIMFFLPISSGRKQKMKLAWSFESTGVEELFQAQS